MLKLVYTSAFKRDLKKIKKDKPALDKLKDAVDILAKGESLPLHYRPHQLAGNYKNCMECHIKPDLLLIYKIDNHVLVLVLLRIGSHKILCIVGAS